LALLLALKGNHPLAHTAVAEHFDQHSGATHEALLTLSHQFWFSGAEFLLKKRT
jgi:hypothetical protein